MLAFDHATDAFFDYIGIGVDYLKSSKCSTFTLEAHITYERELMENDPMMFETQLLNFDKKRLHYVHMMYHADEGYLASTNELISLHVDMSERRSKNMPQYIIDQLNQISISHKLLTPPKQTGRVISIDR
tara:strand:+ start:729 stop:1118 length:390 start_codon:yes stop_codon:yes gene_type:complete